MKKIKDGSMWAITVTGLRAAELERNHRKAAARLGKQKERQVEANRRNVSRILARDRAIAAAEASQTPMAPPAPKEKP